MNADAKQQHLVVVALGGNAISPPAGDLGFATERAVIDHSIAEIAELATGARLLIVHGNGPQVGRLLAAPGVSDPDHLDIHVAQTQGEIGYLIAEALDRQLGRHQCLAILTRVLVDPDDPAFHHPTKPVGRVLPAPPPGLSCAAEADGRGWRRVVASPPPVAVIEQGAIGELLRTYHVVAGGGGGIALSGAARLRRPQSAVVDKDWVAALLAIAFGADRLLFVTNVSHAFDRFGDPRQAPIATLTISEARRRLLAGTFAPGSMETKIESAVQFVSATGRPAVIAAVGAVNAALRGTTGTTILPDR